MPATVSIQIFPASGLRCHHLTYPAGLPGGRWRVLTVISADRRTGAAAAFVVFSLN